MEKSCNPTEHNFMCVDVTERGAVISEFVIFCSKCGEIRPLKKAKNGDSSNG